MKTSFFAAFVLLIIASTILVQCKKDTSSSSTPKCPVPAGMRVSGLMTGSAVLHWANQSAVGYTVQYRAKGTTVWNTVSSQTDSVLITGLQANTAYVWQVNAICATTTTAFSDTNSFITSGCPYGYEGADCMTLVASKFYGIYDITDTSSNSGAFTYTMTITGSPSGVYDLVITNFAGVSQTVSVIAQVSGNTFTIRDTTVNNGSPVTITHAAGVFSNNGDITFHYTYSDAVSTDMDRAAGTKR